MAKILALTEIQQASQDSALAQATEIFFETASITTFDSLLDQEAFYQRWFGHYLDADPSSFLVAIDDDSGAVIGYLAGCIDSFSKKASRIIEDIAFYTPDFCAAMRDYPSHLHINVKPEHQGKGIGRLLMERYVGLCRDLGSPGVHVVTDMNSRAVRFYRLCAFIPYRAPGTDPDLALLVRPLSG